MLAPSRCHGEKDNVVFDLAQPHNVLQSNKVRYEIFDLHRSNGTQVPVTHAEQLLQLIYGIIDANSEEMQQCQDSVGDYAMQKYTAALKTPEFAHISPELAGEFIEFYEKFENSYDACDTWFDASCAGLTKYWKCDGDQLLSWPHLGYRTVFDLLAGRKVTKESVSVDDESTLPIDRCIRFGKEVQQIVWSGSAGVPVRVDCTDGSSFEADHVICTVSLGVLKENVLERSATAAPFFQPALPPAKLRAIDGLTLGTVDKMFVHFEHAFWPADWTGFSLLWRPEDKMKLSAEDNWLTAVSGMYRVDHQPNVLCGWIAGELARHMERLSDAEVLAGLSRLCHQFLSGSGMVVSEPDALQRSQWYSNPHFRGSYTFRSMRAAELRTDPAALALPVYRVAGSAGRVPVLQFAGEATHDHYYSTVHGAVETGWREAKRLIDLYAV